MSISNTDVEKIAYLARMRIQDEDIPKYAKELSNILSLVEAMNEIETDAIEPMAHPIEASQRMRADVVTEDNQRDKFQKQAPQHEAGLYLVPKVIE